MTKRKKTSLKALLATCVGLVTFSGTPSFASPVTITGNIQEGYTLLRDGEPYMVNGVGGSSNLKLLNEMGGNAIRTWGAEQLEETRDGMPFLDYAHKHGISVTVGLWIGHERHGFNYSDRRQVQQQRNEVRRVVRKYKDHPAVLIWGLGNEMEGPTSDGRDPRIWQELNELAKIIKEEDPHHPVMTVIAGYADTKIQGIMQHYPEIDILGINAYGGAEGAGRALVRNGWQKPFMLTEFGPVGHWEVASTAWGAPIEQDSQKKAASYFATQRMVSNDGKGMYLGSYAFLWGNKQEVTPTWYGMFLPTGEKLPTVDAMSRAWTGQWPANRSPVLREFTSEIKEARVQSNREMTAQVIVEDPDGDELSYEWVIMEESRDRQVGGDHESVPPSFPELILRQEGNSVTFRTPRRSGAYRLFVYIRDGQGGAATYNTPFYVR